MGGRGGRGGSKGATAPSSLVFLDKLRRPVGSGLPGLGPRRGLGGEERCHPSAQAPSHTPPGPRSIPAAPASLPRRTGLPEEPDGCGGGGEASRLPGPDYKYLLCFVWPLGEGQEGCSIRPELPARRGPEVGAGFGPRAPH